jgi:glycosyltransferase involved in cell wall biosynthesis
MNFSVLISVYIKEKPQYLNDALKSLLEDQSLKPNEVVIVKDGPLTNDLEMVIGKYKTKFQSIVKIVGLDSNRGLGKALKIGLDYCSFDLVARMDSDDICHDLRFEKQIKLFTENPKLDIVGANIAEFFDHPNKVEFVREVPTFQDEIIKMLKRRNPINHVSVMFRKSSVIKAGSYKHLYFLEDYYLWVRMLAQGFNVQNVDETLVYVRTGENMFIRRSNPEYIKSWFVLQKEMKRYNLIGNIDFLINMMNIIGFIYMPPSLKRYLYSLFLRKSTT